MNNDTKKFGTLFIVATPIGNLEDITLRALETLRGAARIAAEDTRHSQRLLAAYQINKPLIALHDFNENSRSKLLIKYLEAGENIALISDAGTPLISDPGFYLVNAVRQAGFKVVPIPGPCAAVAALSVAGLPTDQFLFVGFLAAKATARKTQLSQLKNQTATLVFYESPHRLLATVEDLIFTFGPEREAVIAKELTKQFETIYNETLANIKDWLAADLNRQKGEFVILVHGAEKKVEAKLNAAALETFAILNKELPTKQASKLAAAITGVNKNFFYKLAHNKEQQD